jgi:hypothetical protein
MNVGETARKNYESARQEIMGRIQFRDNIFLAFLTAVATIFGIALGSSAKPEILLIIPYLTLGATTLIVQHHGAIAAIVEYLSVELEPLLKEIGEFAPHFDNSNAKHSFVPRSTILRTLGHIFLIIIPSIASLVMNWKHSAFLTLPFGPLWWFGAFATMFSAIITTQNHRKRMKLQRRMVLAFSERMAETKNSQSKPGSRPDTPPQAQTNTM